MQELIYTLFGDALTAERRICVVTLPDKAHVFHASIKDAYGYAAEAMQKAEVYFCVGLMKGDDAAPHRYEKDVLAIGGFWADIDLEAPYRKGKKALPKTMDEAKSILAKLPLEPSALVDSGRGLHVYWVFREPWVFDSDDERLKARRLSDGWKGIIQRAAGEFGWAVDSVSELNRIMRLPGTINRKGDVPVEVRVLESHDDIRHNPSDFEEYASAQTSSQETQGPPALAGTLVLNPSAQPPAEKFAALMRDVPLFEKTWNRQRDDFKTDRSQSVYDMALADIAALNGWTPQEIANLLIAARTKYNDNVQKALRTGYMEDTVGKATCMAKERTGSGVDLSCFMAGTPPDESGPKTLRQLVREYPSLRQPIIEGLLRRGETMNIISATKIGKALALDTPILADSGWTTMGDIRPGMKVHACDGTLTEIVAVSEIMHGRPCCRVITKSGASVVADENHLWSVIQRGHADVVTTKELPLGYKGRRWLLPVAQPLVREHVKLPLDPWLLGYWLGNGTAREGGITINTLDIASVHEHILRAGFDIGRVTHKGGATTFTVIGLKPILREMRLLNNKHIPQAYLTASLEQRAALLAGLLDSDGYAATLSNGSGQVEFCTTDETLALQTSSLIRSLGYKACFMVGRASFEGIDCGLKMRIFFTADREHSLFSLPRKTAALPVRSPSLRSFSDAVESVEPVPSVPVRCIQVAHSTGTFLAGESFMVTHNSWLATDLALAVATGRPWLGMETVKGDVLILDNELHPETSANRIPKIAKARGIDFEEVAEHLLVHNLRGQLQTIDTLEKYFRQFEPGRFSMVILDAFYRFLPVRTDENDNGTMANLYNRVDYLSDRQKCSFVLIHHTSKGNQSLKEVTDVGAGAGSQSRATDTHLVLRRHEEEDAVVLDAAVRSWPPREPICLRWAWPVWLPADDLAPDALKKEGGKKTAKVKDTSKRPEYDVPGFVKRFIAEIPKSEDRIHEEAEAEDLSGRRTSRFIRLADQDGLIFSHVIGPKGLVGWATVPQPEDEIQDDRKRAAVETLLGTEPDLPAKEVAERCGVSRQYVNRIRKESK